MVDKNEGSLSAAGDQHSPLASGRAAPVPPVGGFTNGQIMSLLAAGRLLQSKTWPGGRVGIAKMSGESYPAAVARAIAALSAAEREGLRELVSWVRDYEQRDE